MKTAILIQVACDNNNIVYTAAVEEVKKEIIAYFGKKSLCINEPGIPAIVLDCHVEEEDMRIIKKSFADDYVNFLVIRNTESKCIESDIITLPD